MTRFARHWWPIPAMLAATVAIQNIWFGRYEATGHAAGHLASASAIFAITFVLAVLVWASPPQIRRSPGLWVLAAGVAIAAVVPTIGNLRVVNAVGTDNWTDDQASTLGQARPGFESGHDLAERGMWIVVGCAVVLAGWLWATHAVRTGVGIGAIVVSVIFPPWIFPGAGIIVLTIATFIKRAARLRQPELNGTRPGRQTVRHGAAAHRMGYHPDTARLNVPISGAESIAADDRSQRPPARPKVDDP